MGPRKNDARVALPFDLGQFANLDRQVFAAKVALQNRADIVLVDMSAREHLAPDEIAAGATQGGRQERAAGCTSPASRSI